MANMQRDRGKERFWKRHVAGWRRSGGSIRNYCRAEGLSEPSFYAWRRMLTERGRDRGRRSRRQTTEPAFVPVRLVEEVGSASVLEVVLRGGRVVRVPVGFAAASLREVVAVLEGLPC